MITGQATSKTVGEGVGVGTKTAGRAAAGAVLIGVSVAFLIWDTVDLGKKFTKGEVGCAKIP